MTSFKINADGVTGGEIAIARFDPAHAEADRTAIAAVVMADRATSALSPEAQAALVDSIAFAAGQARTEPLERMCVPNTRKDALMRELFSQSVLKAWVAAGLPVTITDNGNGQSDLVAFSGALLRALGIFGQKKSLQNNLRRAAGRR